MCVCPFEILKINIENQLFTRFIFYYPHLCCYQKDFVRNVLISAKMKNSDRKISCLFICMLFYVSCPFMT